MEATSYLIFRLHDSRYAVEALAVREIAPLPEIIPLDETPGYVVGVVNLRGQLVPVIDLNLRFGHPAQPCHLEDYVVFLERGESAVGLIVDEVLTVRNIAPEERTSLYSYGAEAQPGSPFLTGLIKSGEHVVMVLHLENLLCFAPRLSAGLSMAGIVPDTMQASFCAHATPQERVVFRERARNLAQTPESTDHARLQRLAIVRLGEEFFGIDLQAIREFTKLCSVSPVPCCPAHIIGQTNLRGDLITLIDIAAALGLRPTQVHDGHPVVVLNSAELRAGILVDEVRDVLYLRAADVTRSSTAAQTLGQEYLLGTTPYGSGILSLLDLPTLLRQQSLIVNEKP